MLYEKMNRTPVGFYPIYKFMEHELGLRCSELRVYALLFSFTLGKVGMYYGSRKYLADTLSISERTVYRILKILFERGLIENVCDKENGRSGIRCSNVHSEPQEKDERKLTFIERCKENALNGYVKRKYGELSEEDHRIVKAAAEERFYRQAKERELDEQVRSIMKSIKEQRENSAKTSQ